MNASLFAYDFNNVKNFPGEGIDLQTTRFYAVPRSLSYMLKPRNHPGWSLEFAYLNVFNVQGNFVNYFENDILTYLPGTERYKAYSNLETTARTDYFGAGGSIKIGENFFVESSMFVFVNSKYSAYQLDINASPTTSLKEDKNGVLHSKTRNPGIGEV